MSITKEIKDIIRSVRASGSYGVIYYSSAKELKEIRKEVDACNDIYAYHLGKGILKVCRID